MDRGLEAVAGVCAVVNDAGQRKLRVRLVVGQITDEVPSPICGLGDGQRLVGVNIVGALALCDVLCQPHGCGIDGHGGGVLADRDRVDDVSDNCVCADLGFHVGF